jgi:surface protein
MKAVTPTPTSNRYLQYVPCCVDSGPTLYFRVPAINVPIDGVASYVGTINSDPYPTTDVNCNLTASLVSNKCYSITLHTTGVGQPVSTVTQYNCLAIAPQNISGNYIYYSPVYPALPDSSCTKFINDCPDCNPLCFTLWSCDGSQPLITTSTDLTGFVGSHITVSSVDLHNNIVDLCVFVQNTTEFNCTNTIEVIVTSNSCICDCTCYTVTGNIKSIEYIDCFGDYVLIPNPGISTSTFCTQAYPIVFSNSSTTPTTIITNGDCIESTFIDAETCEEVTEYICEELACYLLEDCTDNTNVIYSNSPALALPANLGQVVTIAGHSECWKILIPEECICPIDVTILTTSACCLSCLPNINYKLTLCNNPLTFSYTSDDLSLYVNKTIRREDCPDECWNVTEIDGNIPSDSPVVVLEDYLNCELCYKKYYKLQDCLGYKNDIITYTDLSDYVDKIITLDWCPEVCWEVSETIIDDGSGVISNVLDSYDECITCLTSAPCICSTIKNYNDIVLAYDYLDCEGEIQTVLLNPGQKSDRLCLIRWYAPKNCESFIVKEIAANGNILYGYYYNITTGSPIPIPNYLNGKPTFYSTVLEDYIYYDGKKWILSVFDGFEDKFIAKATLKCGLDCDCPIGSWINISSLSNQSTYTTIEFKYTIEYFGNCVNGVCPPRKNNQKSVTPGYNTPGCEAWKYEEISCRAADAMYKQVLQLRYGISNCCPEEDEQYIVQKELIDLAALYNPAYPCATNSCGCNNDCNCSTAEPVCPPIPLTYNCFCTHTSCECIEIGNGSGEYSTLALCQTSCVPIPVTYNCVNNNCTNPGDGSGDYLTLEACEEECQPVTTYNCTNGSCVPVSGPLGQFSTLQDCDDNCQPVTSYNCVDGNCVLVSGSSGDFPTLQACEIDCSQPHVTSYNCTNGECILVSGSGGEYPTLQACQDDCARLTSYNCTDCECISVSGSGGNFPTLQDCIDADCSTDSFITTWETTTAGESITLPYETLGIYSGTINWGDGNTSINSYTNRTHTYATAGFYTITICSGTITGWNFNLIPISASKIQSVVQWGQLRLGNSNGNFSGCTNLDLSLVSDVLDLTGVSVLGLMFSNCTSLTTVNNINLWNTSAIINMNAMFSGCINFNQTLSFNTAMVTNMSNMFFGCTVFNSVLTFNTILVNNMANMFSYCTAFNQPLSFNTVAVLNMAGMFENCTNFNRPLPWNTGAVTNMAAMFASAPAFQQNLGAWTITSVTNFTFFMVFKTPATWPTAYFDNLLCGWSPQIVTPSLTIDFGTASYTNLTGGPCRTVLQGAPKLWTITSGPGV